MSYALNAARSNAVLLCHALTGDQYVAERQPLTGKPGWWENMVGPGLPIDTDRFFVICSNVLGGCMGSTGPRSVNPGGQIWGTDFPPITLRDMVRAQQMLVARLGISRLFAVIGGSMGGMQVLQWAATFPDQVFAAIPIATAAYHSAQNIAFNEVSRQAIAADPDFAGGRYWAEGKIPARGLAVARMMAHITYLSEEALNRKFGRKTRRQINDAAAAGENASFFGDVFEVESYLRHQGSSFVRRFDANSYLTVTRAMEGIIAGHKGDLPRGSHFILRGQSETMKASYLGLLAGLAFSILLVYLLIVVNFQSWLDPFIILMALPGALSGITTATILAPGCNEETADGLDIGS